MDRKELVKQLIVSFQETIPVEVIPRDLELLPAWKWMLEKVEI